MGWSMARAIAVVGLAILLIGCSNATAEPWHVGPPDSHQSISTVVGGPQTAVVVYLRPGPGDSIEVLGAEPIGDTDGADVRFLLSRPVHHVNGDVVIGETFETLAGAVVRSATAPGGSPGPDDVVGIVAELTPTRPGRFDLTSVRLHYRVDGGQEQVREHIDVTFVVCAGDTLPTSCEIDPAP